ncbi:hypothetical protein [Actinomadura coerulea]|uniref:hypothetical protein n=1 Tax=Actinomadura coerulea TaxID=46159 RepID=UPI003448ABDE
MREDDQDDVYPALVRALAEISPAYLHVVHADPDSPLFRTIRRMWPGTLIANPKLPGVTTEHVARESARLVAAGADLIALGRPFLANPDLVERLRLGAPLNPVQEQHLMYTGTATGYTDYPTMGLAARR